jgi:hypothetical protein
VANPSVRYKTRKQKELYMNVHAPLNGTAISFPALKENTDALDILDKEFERAIPADFPVARNTSKSHEISNMIKEFYFGDQHVSEETILQFVNVSKNQLQIKVIELN